MGRFTRNVLGMGIALLASAIIVSQAMPYLPVVESLMLFLKPPLNIITGVFLLMVIVGVVLDQMSGENPTF